MSRINHLAGGTALAVVLAAAWSGQAAAQSTTVEEVVVTGSFIAGTPEDAALPVDVISSDDLQKQGSPSTVELMKQLPVSNGVLGDTNQFDARAQGSEGAATVNLRGLGASRTLVLFNGRRLAPAPIGAGAPDINLLPTAAIGRIEVLKDGAAATYGSDAIGGVVNFITRRNFEGLELNGYYEHIDGSDGGDYGGHIVFGWVGDNANALVTAGWQHRSELSVRERDFALRGYFESRETGWSSGNAVTTFFPIIQTGANAFTFGAAGRRDVGCAPLGGVPSFTDPSPPATIGTAACYWNYTPYDNLVEKEDRYQIYAEVNVDLTDTTLFHVEAFYANTNVPEWATSPSYLALQVPTTATNPVAGSPGLGAGYFVPANNPGYILYAQQNPGALPTGITVAPGVTVPVVGAYFPGALFRPLSLGGNPLFGDQSSRGSREHEGWRISASLTGDLGFAGIGYDAAVTYMEDNLVRIGYDTVVSRFQLALRGLGGPACDPFAGTPGVGSCQWFNPFSNSIPANALTGASNPGFNPAVANDPELIRWFFQPTTADLTTRMFVADLVFNGQVPIELGGGPIGWAAGGQFRKNFFEGKYDQLTNLEATPCVDTPVTGTLNCAVRNGPFMFLGGAYPSDLDGDAWAAFVELSLPFTDSFQAQLAARYEDYGDQGGSTFDPKLALRWQIIEPFALRASVSTTFRAPPLTALDNGQATSLQFLGGAFRAVDILGNPNLEPESATTYSVGAIFEAGNFNATVDYWSFDFENPIVTEPVGPIFSTLFPTGQPARCGDPALAQLQTRFTFQGGVCGTAGLARIATNWINGPGIKTSGVDALFNYDVDEMWGGSARLGGSVTYVREYSVEATVVEGVTVSPAFEGVNRLNYQTQIVPVPQWKASLFAEYTRDIHNLRLTVNYIDSYIDQRTDPYPPNVLFDETGATLPKSNAGRKIDSFLTADLTWRVQLPWDTTAVMSIRNLTDEDPPFARLDLGYDPFTANPLGRTFKLSVTKRF